MLHWADYVVFVLFLLASIAIGLYHAFTGGKQRTNEEFISGNHNLKLIPTAISLIASYMSALTIIGAPAEVYSYGVMGFIGYMSSALVGTLLVSLFVIPWLYPLRLVSVYEYFNRRYGTVVIQLFTSVLGILSAIIYTGTAIVAPAIAMETATGFRATFSIPIVAVVCTLYTALGGIQAVIWTDVFQTIVMMGGVFTVTIKAFMHVGGVKETINFLIEENRTEFNISPNPTIRHTLWGFLFSLAIGNVGFTGLQQSSVQRFSAVPSLSQARRIPIIWCAGTVLFSLLANLSGMAMFAYYAKERCDPILSGRIDNSNQLLSLFIEDMFKGIPGFTGLFLATLYSATLSTVSSTLSGAATNAWDDMIRPRCSGISEQRGATISKLLVLLFGGISIALAFLAYSMKGPVLQITISLMTAAGSPMIGLFVLAGCRCFRMVTWQGALTGAVVALLTNAWIIFGGIFMENRYIPLPPLSMENCCPPINATFQQPVYEPVRGLDYLYSVSYIWYPSIGCFVTVTAGSLASLIYRLFLPKPAYTSILHLKKEIFIQFPCAKKSKRESAMSKSAIEDRNGEEMITNRVTSI